MLLTCLLIILTFEYLRPENYLPLISAIKLNTILPLATFALALATPKPVSNGAVFRMRSTRWLTFFVSLILLSVFIAPVTMNAWRTFQKVLGFLFLYVIVVKSLTSLSAMKRMFATMVAIHVTLVILNPKIILSPQVRSYLENVTFLGDGNDFAWSVCMVLPQLIFLLQEARGTFRRSLSIALLIVLLFAVVGTASRGASLAMGGIFLYQLLYSKRKAVGVALVGMLVLAILIYAPATYFNRLGTIQHYEDDGSARARIIAWKCAVRMAIDHPLTGVGAEHFAVAFGATYKPPEIGNVPWMNAHSIYFKVLGEFGFPGIAFLLGLIALNFLETTKRIRRFGEAEDEESVRSRRLGIALNSSLIGFAVAGTFLSGIYYPHVFVLCGVLESGRRLLDERAAQAEGGESSDAEVDGAARNPRHRDARIRGRVPDRRPRRGTRPRPAPG